MVGHRPDTQHAKQPVKGLCRSKLEERIAATTAADAIDDVSPLLEFLEHLFNRGNIILEIGVNGDHGIAVRGLKSGNQRDLVATVS